MCASSRCGEDARYILCVDPLDGSANTDIDGAVATIFAIYRKARPGCEDILAELVGGAVELVSAGYVLYGPSTIFVCTFRDGVHGFTLDTSLGEFLLSHENVRCPTRGRYYSTNVGSVNGWYPNVKKYLAYLNAEDEVTGRPYSLRYSGAFGCRRPSEPRGRRYLLLSRERGKHRGQALPAV